MLILTRKSNQSIVIDNQVMVKVIRIHGNQVQLGIEAPPRIKVYRQEIYDQVVKENLAAARQTSQHLDGLGLFQPPPSED